MSLKSIPAIVMRGGTSRGVFIGKEYVPNENKDDLLVKLMGSPDPLQVDGLGGGFSSTSKAMIINRNRETGEIDYLFGQVNIDKAKVDYEGNCGNLTSAIGPYAVDNGLVDVEVTDSPHQVNIKLYNINTKKHIVSTFNVLNGKTDYNGGNSVEGVPSTGAKVHYKILDPAGTAVEIPILEPSLKVKFGGKTVEVSVMDITSLYAFVEPEALGLEGTELPPEINSNKELLKKADDLRRAIMAELGDRLPQTEEFNNSEMALRLVMVSKMRTYKNWFGTFTNEDEGDILVRAFSLGKMHHAVPFTAALCLAASAKIPGSIVYRNTKKTDGEVVRIAHPKGIATASAKVNVEDGNVNIEYVGGDRTVRTIMKGEAFVQE